MNVTIDRGNLGREVIRNWVKIHLDVNLLMHDNWGCVFQNMAPPKSILRKGTDMPKSIQRVKFTKAIARHTKFETKILRSDIFAQVNLMSVPQRSEI